MGYKVIIKRTTTLNIVESDGDETDIQQEFKDVVLQTTSGITAYRQVDMTVPASIDVTGGTKHSEYLYFDQVGMQVVGFVIIAGYTKQSNIVPDHIIMSGDTAILSGNSSQMFFDNRIIEVPGSDYGFNFNISVPITGGTTYTGNTDLYVNAGTGQTVHDFVSELQTAVDTALTGNPGITFTTGDGQSISITLGAAATGDATWSITAPTSTGATDFRFQLFGDDVGATQNMSTTATTQFLGRIVTQYRPSELKLKASMSYAIQDAQTGIYIVGQY